MRRTKVPGSLTSLLTAILIVTLHGATVTPSAAQVSDHARSASTFQADELQDVRSLIHKLIEEEGIPSIAVAVAKDGEILWEEGFGWADRERRVPATAHTPYSLASVTKPITSTAVMVLHERGMIDLDAPLEEYLGRLDLTGLAGDTKQVTPRRALAHSAGLPTHFYFYHAGYPPASAAETLARYGIVVFPPGRLFNYSNIGYRSLDVAISTVSGEGYEDFLRKEVFVPLGMTRTAVGVDPAWAAEAATRYDGGQSPIPPYMSDHPGSGDVWSSAHDMLRFGMFHAGTPLAGQRRTLKPETIRAMQTLSSAPGAHWGLGWSLGTDDRGYRVVRHGGQQPGVDNQLVLYPDEGVVIVQLTNQNNWKVRQVADEIAKVVLPDRPKRVDAAVAPPPPGPLPRLSGKWEGTLATYQGEESFTLTFQPDGDVLAKLGDRMTSLVNNFGTEGGAYVGWFYGVMNTSDALRHRHNLSLTLVPNGDEIVGQLSAYTPVEPGIYTLSSFVRLRRVTD
jgi:CubicO group peptidase (beta-lactamase class C family)